MQLVMQMECGSSTQVSGNAAQPVADAEAGPLQVTMYEGLAWKQG